jgi:hypothetical protein
VYNYLTGSYTHENTRGDQMEGLIPVESVVQKIYLIRGQKVMLDSDLAVFYGEAVRRLNEQVKRNIERFPENFMFQLTKDEGDLPQNIVPLSNVSLNTIQTFQNIPAI